MVVDFQHHYVPVELAKKRGLYSDTIRKLPLGEEAKDGILGSTAMALLKV
jgi:hypothetical protein